MTDKPAPKVPRVIKDAGEAVARDIKPALRLMGRIFVNTWLGDQSFVADVARNLPRDKKRSRASESTAHARAGNGSAGARGAGPAVEIIDAEIIEEKNCPTCGNTRRVGRPGHEVPCPSCK